MDTDEQVGESWLRWGIYPRRHVHAWTLMRFERQLSDLERAWYAFFTGSLMHQRMRHGLRERGEQ